MAGTEDTGKTRLMKVFLGVTAGSMLIAVVPQLLNHSYGIRFDLGIWAFVAMIVAGLIGALAGSLGIAATLGALCGTVISLAGGIAYLLLDGGSRGEEWRTIISGFPILAVIGLTLGLLGGLPVWTFRRLHQRKNAPAE